MLEYRRLILGKCAGFYISDQTSPKGFGFNIPGLDTAMLSTRRGGHESLGIGVKQSRNLDQLSKFGQSSA
jgi:hypothetical protein